MWREGGRVNPTVGRKEKMGWYAKLWRSWLGHKSAVTWLGRRLGRVDKYLYIWTNGIFYLSRGIGVSMLLMTTVGRKSGKARTTLLGYLVSGNELVVWATNYGEHQHPGWSANLLANPEALVQRGSCRLRVIARQATAEEKAQLWPLVAEAWHPVVTYESKSGRDIRLFLLRKILPTD